MFCKGGLKSPLMIIKGHFSLEGMMKLSWNSFFPEISFDYFCDSILGERMIHGVSSLKRIDSILPWNRLNAILSGGMLSFPRVRLSKNGLVLPESQYCVEEIRRRERTYYIDPAKLHNQMVDGSVLVIDSIHELDDNINAIAGLFTTLFQEKVQINCYVGGENSAGFDLHWDDHDVIILQLHGSKEWEIRGCARKYPMFKDIDSNLEAPDQIFWEGTLSEGEVLYIPKGWWHKAYASSNLTCHLTIGVAQRTGFDYLTHILDLCKGFESIRAPVPKLAGNKFNEVDYRNHLKEILVRALDQVGVEDFWNHQESMINTRYKYSFPFSLKSTTLSLNTKVALSFVHRPRLVVKENIYFAVFEKTWNFDIVTLNLFKLLWEFPQGVDISNLVDSVAIEEKDVIELLEDMILNGLLVCC